MPPGDDLQNGGTLSHLAVQIGALTAKVENLSVELRDRRDALERAVEFMTGKADKLEDRLRQVERVVAVAVAFGMVVSLVVPTVLSLTFKPRTEVRQADIEQLHVELQNLKRQGDRVPGHP